MRKIFSILVIFSIVFSNSIQAFASSGPDTWSATPASNDFNNANDWTVGSTNKPPALTGDSLVFATSSTTSLSDDLSGLSVTGVTFNSGASSYSISGDSLTLAGNLVNNSTATETLSTALVLSGGPITFTNGTTGVLAITGGVTGAENLILQNNSTTGSGITISGANLNNSGTVTNSGTGSGSVLISAGVGSAVTGIIENAANSALDITGSFFNVNSGGTTVTDTTGTIAVSSGVTGNGNLTINNNTNTANAISLTTNSVNIAGVLTNSGTGSGSTLISAVIGSDVTNVVENGLSSLVLTNGSNAQAATTVTAGTLQVQANGALGTNSSTVSVASGGALDIDGTNYSNTSALSLIGTGVSGNGALTNSGGTATYAGVVTIGSSGASIGGTGNITLSGGLGTNSNTLTKVDADSLILTTSNSNYSGNIVVSAGTLLVGNGASSGGLGSGNVTDNATLAFDNPGSSTVSNVISGTGALIQEGTGAVTLGGVNTYSGATTINSGATVIAGSNSALGTGLGGVTNNGALNIGTQNLSLSSGSSVYTQASGSTLDLTVNSASNYGSISAHSASVLANNTINVTVGGYIPNNAVLSIIDPLTSITGVAPTTVTSTNSFINFVSSITGGDLILTAERSSIGFSSVASNPNATAVGKVLDNETDPSSDLANVLNILEASSSAQVSAALNTLTPTVDRGVVDSSAASLDNFVGAAFQRAQDVLALSSSGNSNSTGVSAGDESAVNGIWGKQYGGYEDQGNRGGIAGYNAWNTGTTVGIDHLFNDNFTGGASLGYGYGRVNSAGGDSTDINSAQGVIYAGYQGTEHPYYVDVAGTVAENWYNGQRDITVDTMNRIADAAYRGTQAGVYLESGYKLNPWNNLQVTPLTSLQYTHLYLNRYDESNAGDLDLNVNSQGYNTLESGLGASIAYPVKYGWGSLTPEFHAKWLYDFIDQDMSVTSSFQGGGSSFTTNGAAPARDGADVGGKLTFDLKNDVSVVGELDTEVRDNFFGIFGSVSVQYKF